MKRYLLLLLPALLLVSSAAIGQEGYAERVKKYIDQYYELAIAEQRNAGIPACITLGQGILETEAGASELVTKANNHFGIKCLNGWTGETFNHNDDKPNECFKKYSSATESFRDHSEHLRRNPRYKSCFACSSTDYASWANGLKKCGYATNPQYARTLIKIIEDFKLQEYTYMAMDSSVKITGLPKNDVATVAQEETTTDVAAADSGAQTAAFDTTNVEDIAAILKSRNHVDSSKIITVNGMKAFYALQGEMLLPYAMKYNVRYSRLLEMNDLPDAPLPYSMNVYLEKKLTYGINETHTVIDGETLFMISQNEGVQLKKIMALNMLAPNEEPMPGVVLELQKPAAVKPEVRILERKAHKVNSIMTATTTDPRDGAGYITINRNKTGAKEPQKAATEKVADNTAKPDKPQTINIYNNKPPATAVVEEPAEDTTEQRELTSLKANLDREVYVPERKKTTPEPKLVADDNEEYYTVQKGETASAIARKNNITVKQLTSWNTIEADKIRPGQRLLVRNGKQPVAVEKTEPVYTPQPQPAQEAAATDKYYKVQRGDNVGVIARKNHITVKQLLAWNDIEADKIKAGQKLLVQNPAIAAATKPVKPQPKAEPKEEPAAEEETTAGTGAAQYTVGRGETVSAIARKNHITVKQLLVWNGIEADKIKAGQKLWVQNPAGVKTEKPTAKAATTVPTEEEAAEAPAAAGNGYYTVGRGETVSAIARKNHITVKQLLAWNGIEADKIKAGQKLRVSAAAGKMQDEDAPAKPTAEQKPWKPGAQATKYYVVKPGETVSSIAQKNHITVKQLLKWNDIDPKRIRDGKKLRVSQ